ncbi:MAG: DMT family transporter [Patescibacteria group bacterium]|nr:DMT family transporter [bacterium]MDZ4221772.1 DMT family transporter [Patescibacteria group bacterium]
MKKYAPYLIIFAALLWSLDGLLRRNLYSLPPATIVLLEHLIGFAVLAPFLVKEFKHWFALKSRTWYSIAAIALLGGTIGTIAYTAALGQVNYIRFSTVVLLQQLQPVFAIALAGLLLKEPITRRFLGLAAIALVAAYFVSFPDLRVNLATGGGTILAALLALVAAFAWGASTVLGRYALTHVSFVSLSGMRFGLTSVFAFLFLYSTDDLGTLGTLSGTQWWYIVAIVFSTGLVALLIYYKGLSHVPARVATILEMTWPVSAVLVDVFFFKSGLSVTQWIGALALILVILTISRDARRHEAASVAGPSS